MWEQYEEGILKQVALVESRFYVAPLLSRGKRLRQAINFTSEHNQWGKILFGVAEPHLSPTPPSLRATEVPACTDAVRGGREAAARQAVLATAKSLAPALRHLCI